MKDLSTGLKNPQKGKDVGRSNVFLDEVLWVFKAKKSDGYYHGEMDAHNFEHWFNSIIDKIEPGSAIVIHKPL